MFGEYEDDERNMEEIRDKGHVEDKVDVMEENKKEVCRASFFPQFNRFILSLILFFL